MIILMDKCPTNRFYCGLIYFKLLLKKFLKELM
jgi:hypothetical protein